MSHRGVFTNLPKCAYCTKKVNNIFCHTTVFEDRKFFCNSRHWQRFLTVKTLGVLLPKWRQWLRRLY